MQNMEWYSNLNKPFLSPPDWVFVPVWTILYIMIAMSFIFFIKSGMNRKKVLPLIFFIIQLILNISWTPVFFGLEKIRAAMIIILMMWIFLFITIITFYKYSKTASILLIPYFIWITFAVYLNFNFLRLNS